MRNIFVYIGKGAYQAKDVENFLAVFNYNYHRINEFELDQLKLNSILIIPGGEIKAYLPAFDNKGKEIIRKFVQSGGVYIGICAGAYIAGSSYNNVSGLKLLPESLRGRETQSTIDVTDKVGKKFQLINENGPDLSGIKTAKVLLKDGNNNPQAVMIDYGHGKVYLFAAHPEGSIYYKLPPYSFSGAKYFKIFINHLG